LSVIEIYFVLSGVTICLSRMFRPAQGRPTIAKAADAALAAIKGTTDIATMEMGKAVVARDGAQLPPPTRPICASS
jgi:hypothetical protein